MGKILTEAQCSRIKAIREEFKPYADKGWMCEGSEHDGRICNVIFNNDTDECAFASYDGYIYESKLNYPNGTSMADIEKMAKIQGKISTICMEA